ncbi:cell division control protein 14, SIN component-domain-containing protein [Globomyces pollinis-pini]|nr:cell division control protein 14, SIN component-domain-containing protein [Globomyces pollinis-pini]
MLTQNNSIHEWQRLEKIRLQISGFIDEGVSMLEAESSKTRIQGLTQLRTLITKFTTEERLMFTVIHSQRSCDIQRIIYELLKKCKSPKADDLLELLTVLDLIQGLSLIHYESKKMALRKHRLNILLTYLSSREEHIVVATLETLQTVLVDSSENIQAFEQNSGLDLVCNLLKKKRQSEAITYKCIELLNVYLQDEKEYPDYSIRNKCVDSNNKKGKVEKLLGVSFVKQLLSTFK